jgi:hypothetical protein
MLIRMVRFWRSTNDVGDVRRVGLARDALALATRALRRTVALLRFRGLAVELHQLREVHVSAEGAFYGIQVDLVAVRRELHARRKAGGYVIHERLRVARIAPANEPGDGGHEGDGGLEARPHQRILRRNRAGAVRQGEGGEGDDRIEVPEKAKRPRGESCQMSLDRF